MKKEARIVLLHTDNPTDLALWQTTISDQGIAKQVSKIKQFNQKITNRDLVLASYTPVNLYVIINDEIHGNWMINANEDTLYKIGVKTENLFSKWSRVVATTDNITYCQCGNIHHDPRCVRTYLYPKIPKTFIDYYIDKYNKGEKIEDVWIEFTVDCEGCLDSEGFSLSRPITDENEYVFLGQRIKALPYEKVKKLLYLALSNTQFSEEEKEKWITDKLNQ